MLQSSLTEHGTWLLEITKANMLWPHTITLDNELGQDNDRPEKNDKPHRVVHFFVVIRICKIRRKMAPNAATSSLASVSGLCSDIILPKHTKATGRFCE